MRKLLLVGVAFGALVTPAVSADIAPYFQAPSAPIWGWTGFYVGGNAGGIFSSNDTIANTGSDTGPAGLGAVVAKLVDIACRRRCHRRDQRIQ